MDGRPQQTGIIGFPLTRHHHQHLNIHPPCEPSFLAMGREREEPEPLAMADAVPEAFSLEASPCGAIPPDGYDPEAVIRTVSFCILARRTFS